MLWLNKQFFFFGLPHGLAHAQSALWAITKTLFMCMRMRYLHLREIVNTQTQLCVRTYTTRGYDWMLWSPLRRPNVSEEIIHDLEDAGVFLGQWKGGDIIEELFTRLCSFFRPWFSPDLPSEWEGWRVGGALLEYCFSPCRVVSVVPWISLSDRWDNSCVDTVVCVVFGFHAWRLKMGFREAA